MDNIVTSFGYIIIVLLLLVSFFWLSAKVYGLLGRLKRKRVEQKERQATAESAERLMITEQQLQVLKKICDFLNEKEKESPHE